MPENFIPLHTEVERIASGNITQSDVLDYQERKGLVSPYEVNQMQVTGNSYDDYELSVWNDFVGEFWNNSVVSAARGLASEIPLRGLTDKLNPLKRSITPNDKIAWVANLIGKEDAYRNSIVGKLLGGLESGYKKIGADLITDPFNLQTVNTAAKKMVGEDVVNSFYTNWINSVDKATENWKAPVTESKGFFKDPSGRSLVKGLGQGLGFMASVLVTKKAGASVSMATSIAQMTPMYYDEAKAAGLTDEQAASFATALSPIIGATEYFGLEAVGKVAMKPALNALRKESVVAGAKAFTRVLEETGSGQKALNAAIKESNTVFGKSLKTIGVSMASGAAIEGGEEFGQTYIEEGYKQYFDKVVLPESKFGADVRSREALLKASEGAFFGGILGGLLAGGHGVFSAPSNQEVVEQSMFNIIDSSNNKEKALKGILSNVETAKAKGTISDKEYEGAKQMAQSLYEYVNSVPVSLNNTTAKYQAYKFISDRNLIAEQLQALDSRGTDPLLATADDDMRGFLESVIGVYNNAIETIGKTKGQVSDAEIERQITELRNTYFPAAEDTAVETAEAGIGEAVETGGKGIEGDNITAEVEAVEGVNDGVIEGVNDGVIEGASEGVNQQATLDAKKADIERRRQEELKNSKIQIPRYFTFKELGGAKGKSGKALSSIESDRNEEIQQDFESKLQEGDKLIEPNGDIYYFKNGKVVKSNGQPRGMDDIGAFINGVTIDRTDKINTKYDAELKALGQQPTSTTQSEIEAKKADIERRRQEELKQPIKDKLQEIEKAVKTLNITIDKDGKLEQTSDEIITNIKSELDKIGLPYKEVVSNEKGSSYKVITNDGTEIEVVRLLKSGGALIKPVLSTAKFINHLIKTEPQTLRDLISNQINAKYDAEVATLDANQATNQAEEKPIAEQVAEYEGILTRNQDKLTKLRSSKLRKGETQEKRDAAIANLEQQESMVREKLDALKQQMPKVETPAVQSASEQIPKLEQTKVTPVAKDGKVIIDESGNLTNELQSQFEVLKDKGDAQGLNDLYSTVRIFLNGIAQSKGDKAVSQLEGLKKQIEDYAKEFKGEAVGEGNAEKEEVAEKEEEKEGFTEGQELNKIYNSLKEKYGDKKGDQLYKTATRLVNPNKNTIVEIRGNGVVVKEGNKYLLKPFGNTDANQNKWTLYEGIDVSDQFTKEVVSPTEQVEQPAEFEEVKQAKEKFYKHTEDNGYVEVKRAKPVYIFGTEKAFYVKEGKEFVVSDAITGAEIGRGSTLNNAVSSAEENAGSVQNLESARERFTDAYGKSPYAKLQEEFSFTQSIINNAMDMADVVEGNGRIKPDKNGTYRISNRSYADVERLGDRFSIEYIESEKKGDGRKIIESIIADARNNGVLKITATATNSSLGFFEKLGFKKIAGSENDYQMEFEIKSSKDLLGGDNTNAYLDTMEDKGIIKRDCE